MFERFTDRARRAVTHAQVEARQLHHAYIGTEHLLLGLIGEGEGVAAKVLESVDVSLDDTRQRVIALAPPGPDDADIPGHIPFTPRAKKVLELSLREALQLGHNYIGTEHVLLGLVREGEGVAAQVLVESGAQLARVRQGVIELLSSYLSAEDRERKEALAARIADLRNRDAEVLEAVATFRTAHDELAAADAAARDASERRRDAQQIYDDAQAQLLKLIADGA